MSRPRLAWAKKLDFCLPIHNSEEAEKLTGTEPRRESSASLCGPCPSCGGDDRFVIRTDNGRWFCRRCNTRGGDSIDFLTEFCGYNYLSACEYLGVEPKRPVGTPGEAPESTRKWEPKPTHTPNDKWAEKALKVVERAQSILWGPVGQEALDYLRDRGLSDETIHSARLGFFVPEDIYWDREAWGLPPKLNDKGNPSRVWLPSGILIPCIRDGQVFRIRIRRDKADGNRYVAVTGSSMGAMVLGDGPVQIVVESELDALLLSQVSGDLAGVMALGSANIRPDERTAETLRQALLILVALDTDQAGADESNKWWAKHFSNARRWPIPGQKDPTEYYQSGGCLRSWIIAGLEHGGLPLDITENWRERCSVLQFDAGFLKHEAEIKATELLR